MCLSSAAVDADDEDADDDDDRFADDGSVYIYREGDGSPSGNDQPGRGDDEQDEDDVEHNGSSGGGFDRDRRNFFAPQGIDGGDNERARRESGGRRWQDEHRDEPPSSRLREDDNNTSSSSCNLGGLSRKIHRGVSAQSSEDVSTTPVQCGGHGGRGGGGHDVEAGVNNNNNDDNRQGNIGRHTREQQQQQQRHAGSSGGVEQAASKHVGSGRGAEQSQAGARQTHEPPGVKQQQGRRNHNDLKHGGFGLLDERNSWPDSNFREEQPPAQAFVIPVPGASYSAKIDRGLQGRGGRETAIARGAAGEGDEGTVVEYSAKVRHTAERLRKMILDRQASTNRSIREVFGHFDRRRCGYVNVAQMRDALADLRLHLSPKEGQVSELLTQQTLTYSLRRRAKFYGFELGNKAPSLPTCNWQSLPSCIQTMPNIFFYIPRYITYSSSGWIRKRPV